LSERQKPGRSIISWRLLERHDQRHRQEVQQRRSVERQHGQQHARRLHRQRLGQLVEVEVPQTY